MTKMNIDYTLDKSKFNEAIKTFHEQFAKANKFTDGIKVTGEFNRVVICGMGGSAMPGDLLKAYLASIKIKHIKIDIHRTYGLPHDIDKKTLIFASSYSGNTEEVVDSLNAALEAKSRIVAFSRGGKIEKIAQENNIPYVRYPEDGPEFQPRNAIGYSFAAMAFILMNSNIIENNRRDILALDDFLNNLDIEKRAEKLATQINDRMPVVVTADEYEYTTGRIIRIKFNENAKQGASNYSIPEMNHNRMVGFTTDAEKYHVLIFKDPQSHQRINLRIDTMKPLLEQAGANVTEIELLGENFIQKMFYGILYGDWLTYYKALLNGIDPTPVDMVEEFKKML